MSETWKPIPQWDAYEVSDLGKVRRVKTGLILKVGHNPKGYEMVTLYRGRGGGRSTVSVARAVASAFLGPRPDGLTINHVDGIKTNNQARNLEYCTRDENNKHAGRLGLKPKGDDHPARKHPERLARGSRQGSSKFTEADIPTIRRRYANGETINKIAQSLGVCHPTIKQIVQRRSWRHVA